MSNLNITNLFNSYNFHSLSVQDFANLNFTKENAIKGKISVSQFKDILDQYKIKDSFINTTIFTTTPLNLSKMDEMSNHTVHKSIQTSQVQREYVFKTPIMEWCKIYDVTVNPKLIWMDTLIKDSDNKVIGYEPKLHELSFIHYVSIMFSMFRKRGRLLRASTMIDAGERGLRIFMASHLNGDEKDLISFLYLHFLDGDSPFTVVNQILTAVYGGKMGAFVPTITNFDDIFEDFENTLSYDQFSELEDNVSDRLNSLENRINQTIHTGGFMPLSEDLKQNLLSTLEEYLLLDTQKGMKSIEERLQFLAEQAKVCIRPNKRTKRRKKADLLAQCRQLMTI